MKTSELLRSCVGMPWCQGEFAKTAEGKECGENRLNAASWCALGRVYHKVHRFTVDPVMRMALVDLAIMALEKVVATPETSISHWNDVPGRTIEEVDAAFLAAADIAESEGN